ncbi:hypothetical protein [Schaalia hyovaginalis]|uniref:hypothetical protein n=1 Tax=Schaalia hyovaginalis TaxID=29316 RepID=UPI002A7F1A2E|nr:hypothetical protein [Schaalia hyovaginalis]MDY4491903.1 hypothetical protein [Schaalia hyovaginalis]
MTGILDGSVKLDGGAVEVTGIKALLKDAEAVGVAVEDLKDLTYRLATPIADLARTLAPVQSGRLAAGIKPAKSKRKVMIRVGSASRLPYAGVRHWGADSRSGPRWLSKAEETMRPRTFAGFGEGIKDLLEKHNW